MIPEIVVIVVIVVIAVIVVIVDIVFIVFIVVIVTLKSKVSLTHWLSEWQCQLLSCPGQLKKLQGGGKVRQIQTDTNTPLLYTGMDKTSLDSGGQYFCKRCWPACCKRRWSITTFFLQNVQIIPAKFSEAKKLVLIYTHFECLRTRMWFSHLKDLGMGGAV